MNEKPWVVRTWAGSRLLTEARYAKAWEAQDALVKHAEGDTGFSRVTLYYEPEAIVDKSEGDGK